jgi:hypothetical protein
MASVLHRFIYRVRSFLFRGSSGKRRMDTFDKLLKDLDQDSKRVIDRWRESLRGLAL